MRVEQVGAAAGSSTVLAEKLGHTGCVASRQQDDRYARIALISRRTGHADLDWQRQGMGAYTSRLNAV